MPSTLLGASPSTWTNPSLSCLGALRKGPLRAFWPSPGSPAQPPPHQQGGLFSPSAISSSRANSKQAREAGPLPPPAASCPTAHWWARLAPDTAIPGKKLFLGSPLPSVSWLPHRGAQTYHSRGCRKQTRCPGRRSLSLSQRSTASSCSFSPFLGWWCLRRSSSSSSSCSHPGGGLSGKTEKSQWFPHSHSLPDTTRSEHMAGATLVR